MSAEIGDVGDIGEPLADVTARLTGQTPPQMETTPETPLVTLAREGNAMKEELDEVLKETAVRALGQLALNADNKLTIAEAGGIEPMVSLLRLGNVAAKEAAACALDILGRHPSNQDRIAKAGAIEPLVAIVREGSPAAKE